MATPALCFSATSIAVAWDKGVIATPSGDALADATKG